MNVNIIDGIRLGIFVFVSMLIIVGCGSSDSGEQPDPDPTGTALWDHMQEEDYQNNWQLFPGTEELYEGTDPHGARLTIYVNDVAYNAVMSGTTPFPNGAIIVKENHMPDSTLAAITTMFKVEGYDSEHNDWFWLRNNPEGVIDVEGRVDGCQTCHTEASATDYVFTEFPNE